MILVGADGRVIASSRSLRGPEMLVTLRRHLAGHLAGHGDG